MTTRKVLLVGPRGWIAGQLQHKYFPEYNAKLAAQDALGGADPELPFEVVPSDIRLDVSDGMQATFDAEVAAHSPVAVLNCGGLTGRPTVDWCEDHKREVVATNLVGTLRLMELCERSELQLVNMATGCIFKYDEEHHPGAFTEEDAPNFTGSFYSLTKGYVDVLSTVFRHTLTLRLRMPITCDGAPRCFVTKIAGYRRVVDIPNSVSVLPTLLPLVPEMVHRRLCGIRLNFVNSGVVSHNEVLDAYRRHVDASHVTENFTEAEQATVLKAGRSNTHLDTTLLEALFPGRVPAARDAIEAAFKANYPVL